MLYPDFYSQIAPIKLYDPLSDFLGAFKEGELEITYLDCVKLAGHSCPTVAGAYLMALKGIEMLYGDDLPQRGSVKIEMKENESAGVAGVTANILSFILGAGGVGGFKGIQGNFSRNGLLFFGSSIDAEVRLTRLDTMQSVDLSYDPSLIKADKKIMPLMSKTLKGFASKEEKKLFQTLWHRRVEAILLGRDNHDRLITITKNE
ncbi:MAG: hypothetical protein KC427_07265 [Sulfurovum sp.]|uniref:hypothetical protein n=1 Tax=Sulfurovum sp. TaxID=1969726 RepID=UPI00286802C7|nr:hypothetical protein [Sulfurovum sp.]MCO4845802.1 hypothetical protein [Sulfurovum sp.]